MKEKLLKIQTELKAPKNQVNSFGGYNYRSCEDILEAIKPLLKKEQLLLRLNDELVNIGERYYIKATAILTDGTETIENVAYAREEETKKGMDGSQITGASSSYARKYALNGLFLIDDVKDSDTTNVGSEPTLQDAKEWKFSYGKYKGETMEFELDDDNQYVQWYINNKANEYDKKCYELLTGEKLPTEAEQDERIQLMNKINELALETDTDFEEIHKHFQVQSLQQMTIKQMKECIKILEMKILKKVANEE